MSGPSHTFPSGFANNQQNTMRNQFSGGPMQSQMNSGMPSHMGPQMGGQMAQMGSQMGGQMVSPMNQLSQSMNTGMASQMMGQMNQPYGMNSNMSNTMNNNMQTSIQQAQNQLQMQQQIQQQQMQQQQVQQPQQQNTTPTPPAPQPVQSKEINTVSLCRIGQETVQDIVSRTQEVFQNLKAIQPPNGTVQGSNTSNEKKVKVQEQLRTIRVLFKRLRLIYEKCNENCQLQGMEYTHIESLIPLKDEPDPKSDEKKSSEAYRSICEENKEIMEQVILKNRQLKEVIDHLRRIIWEINTMLAMRRS